MASSISSGHLHNHDFTLAFDKQGKQYQLYVEPATGYAEWREGERVLSRGMIVEKTEPHDGYVANLRLGYHESTDLCFVVYGKEYRLYTLIEGNANGG